MTLLKTFCPAGYIVCFNGHMFTCSQNINQNAQRLELGERNARRPVLYVQAKQTSTVPKRIHGVIQYLAVHIAENSPVNTAKVVFIALLLFPAAVMTTAASDVTAMQ